MENFAQTQSSLLLLRIRLPRDRLDASASRDTADPVASTPKRTRRVRFLAALNRLLSSMFRVARRIFTACNRLPSTSRSLSLLWRNPATPVVRRLVLADVRADRRTAAARVCTCTRAYIRYEATGVRARRRGYFFRFRSPGCSNAGEPHCWPLSRRR